MDHKLKDARV
jgi:hypothetical protein